MAENFRIALHGFWRGFVDLGRGFDWSCEPPPPPEVERRGLGKYFAAVGGYMWRVLEKCDIPEVKEAMHHAD